MTPEEFERMFRTEYSDQPRYDALFAEARRARSREAALRDEKDERDLVITDWKERVDAAQARADALEKEVAHCAECGLPPHGHYPQSHSGPDHPFAPSPAPTSEDACPRCGGLAGTHTIRNCGEAPAPTSEACATPYARPDSNICVHCGEDVATHGDPPPPDEAEERMSEEAFKRFAAMACVPDREERNAWGLVDVIIAEARRARRAEAALRERLNALLQRELATRQERDALRDENKRLREALGSALDRMDRARSLLTKGAPTPDRNWGMLDTARERAALAEGGKEGK